MHENWHSVADETAQNSLQNPRKLMKPTINTFFSVTVFLYVLTSFSLHCFPYPQGLAHYR
jgi:hypothetical protein